MVATVKVNEINGAAGSKVYTPVGAGETVTYARYCTADQVSPALNYPLPIPTSGFRYSYWKSHCLDLSGTFTKINNIRWYTDGAIGWTLGTNGEVRVGRRDSGDNGCPDASYEQATGTQGTTGNDMENATNGHGYYKGQTNPSDPAQNFTSGSPLTVDTSDYTSAGKTKHVVTQVKVASDATQGEQADETFTFMYDEI